MGERYKPLTAEFLAGMEQCCGSHCTNCPFIPRYETGSGKIDNEWLAFAIANPEVTYEEYQASRDQSSSAPSV